ncbi:hypothetical protein ABZ697_14895 [Streptomyces albidoflavus]|uniref:hypothetical protein n=1 Tax=Streptomyces albidoflavus TaxID=1886 RepID=UPI0033E24060
MAGTPPRRGEDGGRTILAAFGTALPESVVTLVAVTTGESAEARNIGVGAALGGPLALATVAYGVTGAVLLLERRRHRERSAAPGARAPGDEQDMRPLAKGQLWFLPVFAVGLVLVLG